MSGISKTIEREIPLTHGRIALVDEGDFEWLNQWKWHTKIAKGGDYAARTMVDGVRRWTLRMHRLILDASEGTEVDHINGNGLDNRRENLRLCTHKQNSHNQQKPYGSSKYKGVCRKRGGWDAQIKVSGKIIWLGSFADEDGAANAYDEAALKHFGEFAFTNKMYIAKQEQTDER